MHSDASVGKYQPESKRRLNGFVNDLRKANGMVLRGQGIHARNNLPILRLRAPIDKQRD